MVNSVFTAILPILLSLSFKPHLEEVKVSEKSFGKTKKGDEVRTFELKNDNGMVVRIINYGGIRTSGGQPHINIFQF